MSISILFISNGEIDIEDSSSYTSVFSSVIISAAIIGIVKAASALVAVVSASVAIVSEYVAISLKVCSVVLFIVASVLFVVASERFAIADEPFNVASVRFNIASDDEDTDDVILPVYIPTVPDVLGLYDNVFTRIVVVFIVPTVVIFDE